MLSDIQSSRMKSFILTSLRFSLSSCSAYILAFLLTLQGAEEFFDCEFERNSSRSSGIMELLLKACDAAEGISTIC